jgi:hypothetical protein
LFEDDEYLINVAKDVIIHIHNFGVPIKTNAVMWITSDSGVCIYAYIKIISAILGELTQVTISRNCTCEFDMAAQVSPEKMHWARYHDRHMVPVALDDNGINQLNLMTLVANTRRECIESKFGIETAEVLPAATEDDAVMIRLPADNAVLTEIETAEVLPAATEDDAVMICLAQEAKVKVYDFIKQFKVDICNRFKAKEIEQANKIAEVEKEMMNEINLLKNGLVKITIRSMHRLPLFPLVASYFVPGPLFQGDVRGGLSPPIVKRTFAPAPFDIASSLHLGCY